MAYREKTLGRLAKTPQMDMKAFTVPASVGGINALTNLMGMPPDDCLSCDNLMPSEYGLRLRKGYFQTARGVGDNNDDEIRSIIPFEGQATDASQDRLFCASEWGIYDVTQYGDTNPVRLVDFTQQGDAAGWGVSTEFTNDSTDRFMFFSDGLNGLHVYEESTGLWDVPAFTGGIVVADVAFVMSWKNRLWMIEEASGDAWYTDVDAVGGQAKKFTFGSKFKHGGELKCLYNWTIDGGNGIDDYLVSVSRGGDVLVYQGIDPETDMTLVGSYFIGEVPESRRLGVNYGGELYLLSTYGITSIRDLLQGVVPSDAGKSPSAKISRFVREEVQVGKDDREWALNIYPGDGFLQIVTPWKAEQAEFARQYNQNLLTTAWGRWRNVPINSANNWNARYYFGDKSGNIWTYGGTLDGTTLLGLNIWDDIPTAVGNGWSTPGAGVYPCDGTQTADTLLTVGGNLDPVPGTAYIATYVVTDWAGGEHGIRFGGAGNADSIGNGTFIKTIYAANANPGASLVGSSTFIGTVQSVQIREAGILGSPIDFDILTSFQAPNGDHSSQKRVGFIRTIGVLSGTASVNVQAVYDYALDTRLLAPSVTPSKTLSLWDNADWDEGFWDYESAGASFPIGALGLGRVVAIAMRGSSDTRLTVVGWDVTYTSGGFL